MSELSNHESHKAHFTCRYWPVKRTVKPHLSGMKWVERCKHGYYSYVDWSYANGDRKSPQVGKVWFDPEGTEIAKTGTYSPNNASQ